MTTFTLIPLDVIGCIVDEIHDDQNTLKITSLVSRSFLLFSQHKLFSKIHLKIGYRHSEDRRRAYRLQDTLVSNPKLGLFVRNFDLDIRDLWHPQAMTYPQSIHLSDHVLPSIFSFLKSLRLFSLSGLWNPQTLIWKSAILALCKLPSLSHLCLAGIECFPLVEIPQFQQLQRLSLSDTSLKGDQLDLVRSEENAAAPSEQSWLDVLEFDIDSTGVLELWKMMMQPEVLLNVAHLRVLRLTGTNSRMRREVWEIFQAVSESLECLIWEHAFVPVIDILIDSNHWAPYDMGLMDFGILKKLRFIAFSFTLNGPIPDNNTRIPWILNCLQHMGSRNNCLEEFILALFPNPTTPVTFSLDGWTTSLDLILAGEAFPSLTQLSVRLHTPHPDFPFPPSMAALVTDCFPRLRSVGKLSVESSHEIVHVPLFEDLITRTVRTNRA